MSSCVAFYHGHMAVGARLGAFAPQVVELAAGAAPSIPGFQAWKKTWDLRPGFSVNHTDRPIPRPLERSP
jgi:hypothetical protein